MKTEQLRSFVAVCETGNFTKAAQQLYTTQPAVTKHIEALERDLGFKLLERSTRSVALTAAGETFLVTARQALATLDEGIAAASAQDSANPHRLNLGFVYLYLDNRASAWVSEFKASCPAQLTISISEDNPEQLISQVMNHSLDGAFVGIIDVADIPHNLKHLTINSANEIILLSREHPLAKREYLCVEDIANETFVYPHTPPSKMLSLVRRELDERGINIKPLPCDYEGSALKIIEMSGAIMDIPEVFEIVSENLIGVPYRSDKQIHYVFIWDRATRKPLLNDFINFLKLKV
jgi:DNA-binding transcriptional LysR family regulator